MPVFLHRCRRLLAGSPIPGGGQPFREQPRRFAAAQTLVRAFYAFLLYLATLQFTTAGDLLARRTPTPLWPVVWLHWTRGVSGGYALLAFYFATNVLGAFFVRWRAARLVVFLGLLEFVALKNSFGKVGHSLHLPVLVAGLLVFLPEGWTRPASLAPRALRQQTLLIFWLAQAAVLLAYTMSGLGKLGGAVEQICQRQPNVFLPGAFGEHIAQRLVQTSSHSSLGDWIIHHPYLTWPLMPCAVIFETGALLAAFRPALGRPVAALLLLFHVGTFFTMTITFPQNCLLLALFFFPSPFEPSTLRWQTLLFDVPFARSLGACWQSNHTRANDQGKISRPDRKPRPIRKETA